MIRRSDVVRIGDGYAINSTLIPRALFEGANDGAGYWLLGGGVGLTAHQWADLIRKKGMNIEDYPPEQGSDVGGCDVYRAYSGNGFAVYISAARLEKFIKPDSNEWGEVAP